jgi:hypothetical protein
MNNYTIADIVATFSVSERTAQRWVESLVFKENNKIVIPQDVFDLLKSRHSSDTLPTLPDTEYEYPIVEGFTEDEYQEFHKRLSEYPYLKERISDVLNELDYHKRSAESHNRQMEIILQTLQQRNYIEAKEKKLDK